MSSTCSRKYTPIRVVLTRIRSGIRRLMRRIALSSWCSAMIVVMLWRGISALAIRSRQLDASGELALRMARRRADRSARALHRCGLAPASLGPARVLAAVHVGAVAYDDVDDVALLEAAMRRAARDRVGAQSGVLVRGRARSEEVAVGAMPAAEPASQVRWWVLPLAAAAVACTTAAVVRPLADGAPAFAVAGIALVAAAWLASRRDQRME